MELETLRAAAHDVFTELIAEADRDDVKRVVIPQDQNDQQMILAYCFRWLWEHAKPVGDNGEMINQRPLMDAFVEATDGLARETVDVRFKPLRGWVSTQLDEAGLIHRPYTRAWRWILRDPSEDEALALPAPDESSVAVVSAERPLNGHLPQLGEQLTVIGLRLDSGQVYVDTQRDSDDAVLSLLLGDA